AGEEADRRGRAGRDRPGAAAERPPAVEAPERGHQPAPGRPVGGGARPAVAAVARECAPLCGGGGAGRGGGGGEGGGRAGRGGGGVRRGGGCGGRQRGGGGGGRGGAAAAGGAAPPAPRPPPPARYILGR